MTVEELTKENEELKGKYDNLEKQFQGLQGAMIVQLTTSGLFMKPALDIINNLRQVVTGGAGSGITLEEIQITFDSYVQVHLENPGFSESEKSVFTAINTLIAEAQEETEPSLIQRV